MLNPNKSKKDQEMNKLTETQILVAVISLLVLLNNFIWSLEERGSIDIVDYKSEKLEIDKTIN